MPIPGRPVDDDGPEEGHRHQEIGHPVGEILYRGTLGLGFFHQVDDVGQGRILSHLFHADDQFPGLHDAPRVHGGFSVLHGGIRFAGDGGLVHRCRPREDTAVDADLFPGVRGDLVPRLDGFHRHLALHAVLHQPHVTLIEIQKARYLGSGPLRRI